MPRARRRRVTRWRQFRRKTVVAGQTRLCETIYHDTMYNLTNRTLMYMDDICVELTCTNRTLMYMDDICVELTCTNRALMYMDDICVELTCTNRTHMYMDDIHVELTCTMGRTICSLAHSMFRFLQLRRSVP